MSQPLQNAPSALHRCTRCARWHDRGAGLLCLLCQRLRDAERDWLEPAEEWHHASRFDGEDFV